jgi:uncharacterized protein YuzE
MRYNYLMPHSLVLSPRTVFGKKAIASFAHESDSNTAIEPPVHKIAPTIEIESTFWAAYIRLTKGRVVKTERRSNRPLINIDLDKNDHIIGIEVLYHGELDIPNIFKRAHIDPSHVDFSKAKITLKINEMPIDNDCMSRFITDSLDKGHGSEI